MIKQTDKQTIEGQGFMWSRVGSYFEELSKPIGEREFLCIGHEQGHGWGVFWTSHKREESRSLRTMGRDFHTLEHCLKFARRVERLAKVQS